jgi:hypothetical protein
MTAVFSIFKVTCYAVRKSKMLQIFSLTDFDLNLGSDVPYNLSVNVGTILPTILQYQPWTVIQPLLPTNRKPAYMPSNLKNESKI